jgi:hypothetical protein
MKLGRTALKCRIQHSIAESQTTGVLVPNCKQFFWKIQAYAVVLNVSIFMQLQVF